MKTFTLEEFGNKLPIPLEDNKRPSFDFRPWRMHEEKKIGELKTKHRHIGRFVRELFDFMLTRWDGADWSAMSAGDRKLLINRMPWANVFYMYMWLRVDALGEDMKMAGIQCPNCGTKIDSYTADLHSLEVKCHGYDPETGEALEEGEERIGSYELKKPFHVGDVKVTKIKFSFTPWDAMEKIKENSQNEGAVKESMMAASYRGVATEESDHVELQIDKVLSQLSKRDIEGYFDTLDGFNGGPNLSLDVECHSCGFEFSNPLNWTYDYFFGNSSR